MRAGLRDLLVLAWPVVVSRATQTVVGLADALMVAHLGARALAATTTGATNAFLLTILPIGTVFIVQSFASQLAGKGDLKGARRFAVYGLLIAVATQVVALGSLFAIEPLLSLFEYEPDVRALMAGYLSVRLLSAGPAVGLEVFANYYGGLGRTRIPMVANLAAMALNVVLNAVLIDGRFGAPALGVVGASIASSISTTAAFLALFAYFVREGRLPSPRLGELIRTLRFGIPSGLNWFFEFLAFNLFINIVVAGLGTTALASLMAVLQINMVSFMPAFGIASAGAILVGQAIGRGERDDVPRMVRMTFAIAASWQGVVGLAYLVAPALILSPFAGDTHARDALLELGIRMLMLSTGWQLFDAAAIVLSESLRAAGDTLWPLIARLMLAWFIFLPGSWVSVRLMGGGDVPAMLWLIAYLGLLALALLVRFMSGRWRSLELTEEALV